MRRLIVVAVVVPLLCAGARARAGEATTSSASPIRIGYVDLDRVASESQMVKSKVSEVERSLTERQKTYKVKSEELRQLRDQLSKQESVLTPAQSDQLKERIRKSREELSYIEFEGNQILGNTSREVIEPVLDQVLAAVERVAKAYGIDLILRGDLVLFASERVDLTDLVIRELDRGTKTTSGSVSPTDIPARRSGEKKATPTPKSGGNTPPKKVPKSEDGVK